MTWIAINVSLPEEDKPVLIAGNGKLGIGWYQAGRWRWGWGYGWDPSHWMPLPKPPARISTQ